MGDCIYSSKACVLRARERQTQKLLRLNWFSHSWSFHILVLSVFRHGMDIAASTVSYKFVLRVRHMRHTHFEELIYTPPFHTSLDWSIWGLHLACGHSYGVHTCMCEIFNDVYTRIRLGCVYTNFCIVYTHSCMCVPATFYQLYFFAFF